MRRKIQKIIRFSEEEWSKVLSKAEAAGMKPAVFIRNIAANGQVRIYDLQKYQSLVAPIRGICSVMNQIAKVANSTGSIYEKDVAELRENTAEVRRLVDIFFKDLRYEAV